MKLTVAAFAKSHGVSKQAAAKWRTRGHLVIAGSLVEVEASDQRLRDAKLGRFADRRSDAGDAGAAVSSMAHPDRDDDAPAAGVAPIIDHALDTGVVPNDKTLRAFVEDLSSGRIKSLADAATVKENALALKHTLTALLLNRSVIDIGLAEAEFFEAFRSSRDAWLGFPSRVGPLIAADLGIETDRIVEVLTTHVHQQLSDLGEPEVDFAGGNGATPVVAP